MFVRGGLVSPGSDLRFAGLEGYYWSSVSYGRYSAYYLRFYPSGVNPSDDYTRHYGFSVRCVALGG